jgi:anti-anti-sigma factor
MTWRLRATPRVSNGICTFTLDGRLGTRGGADLLEAVIPALDGGHRDLLLDLTGVDYASSAGLLALDAVSGKTFAVGGTLVLCGVSEPVRLALELAGLLPHFTVDESFDAAVARFGSSRS